MSNVFSYRIQAGFGATENFGFSTLMLSWKGHLELLGKTEEAWLEVEDAWRELPTNEELCVLVWRGP